MVCGKRKQKKKNNVMKKGVQYSNTRTKQSWKCIRRSAAGTVLSLAVASFTVFKIIYSRSWHDFS